MLAMTAIRYTGAGDPSVAQNDNSIPQMRATALPEILLGSEGSADPLSVGLTLHPPMQKQLLLALPLATLAVSSLSAQLVTRSVTAPSSSVVSYTSDETSGVNTRYRSGNADTDAGQVFTPSSNLVATAITVRTRDFVLAANPVLQLDFYTVSGSGDPSPIDNSSTTKTALTSHTFTHAFSVTGSLSTTDFNALSTGSDQYLTFDLSGAAAGLRTLTANQKYAFVVGFAGQTSSANDRIRWVSDGTSSYGGTDAFEIRRDYEFDTSGRDAIECAASNRDLEFYVIPEPSTYAALAGILSLGLVAYRRRR